MYSQSIEWSVLESIHPTICVSIHDAIAILQVPVELPTDSPVHIFHDTSSNVSSLSASLSVLPPLHLRIFLPPLYPSQAPPIIQSLQATSAWIPLSTLSLVKERLNAMWSPGDGSGILYTWVEWIRTGHFLTDVGLADDSHSIRIPHTSPQLLLALLTAYASASKSQQFALSSYLCAICLSQRKGIHGLILSCGHVFCRTCLIDMWELHIREGQISHVGCPEPKCGYTDEKDVDGLREVTEDEVKAVLSEDQVDRWKWLRKKRDLERDPSMIICPMEYCQEPVPRPRSTTSATDDDESGWARLRTCNTCGYSFCAFCRRTWHGPHTTCPLPLVSQFILEYLSALPGSSNRGAIERRYGRSNVLKLVRQHKEEQENREWMDSSTMSCPGCKVRVEKSMGCNHMTCTKCGTHFCYRCGTKLSGTDPYQHFSSPHMPCFSKLFDFIPHTGDGWQPVEGFEFI